jgi:hypothetical protein
MLTTLALGIIRQVKLDLLAPVRLGRIKPCAVARLLIEALTGIEISI